MLSISHVDLDRMVLVAGPLAPGRCTEHGPGVPGRKAFETRRRHSGRAGEETRPGEEGRRADPGADSSPNQPLPPALQGAPQ